MPLTNAERQAAWRKRMAARASGELVGEVARETMDAALAASWEHLRRTGDASVTDIADLAAWRASWAGDGKGFADLLRELVQPNDPFPLSDVERVPIERALEVIDAAALRAVA